MTLADLTGTSMIFADYAFGGGTGQSGGGGILPSLHVKHIVGFP